MSRLLVTVSVGFSVSRTWPKSRRGLSMAQVRACKAFVNCAVMVGLVLSNPQFSASASTSSAALCGSAAVLHDSWVIATSESVGFESRQLCTIGNAVRHGRLRNLHGVVVVRRGRLV